ncbi:MAG TPA: PA14 domain-containing protein [Verrucomicrobiae bacterium]|nr:PA14 domain-containing protein [Verrucomicrobiae bacterium]
MSATSTRAEDVFVSASLGTASAQNTPCPPSCYSGSVSASGSSAFSSATPQPPQGSRRSRFGFADGCTWSVQPGEGYSSDIFANAGTAPLQSPGVYKIYATLPANTSCSANLLVNMTATGGDLADPSGAAATEVPVTAFRSTNAIHTWIHIGYITNTQPDPTLTFTFVSADPALASANRWYMDTIRFENIGDPCFSSGATQVGITGPLAAGGTNVTVTSVTAGATNVTVFANGIEIGATNFAAGFAAGSVIVPTSAMNQGDSITAIQTKGGCTSQVSSSALVGGGPNAQLRAFVTCWKNSTNTGPVGANSSAPASGFFYMLGATGLQAGFGSAPVGGRVLPPGACWQLVSFQNGVDDAIDSNQGTHVTNTDAFCSLEGMVFSIDSTDNGPYDIYIDQIMNGDTVVEDFESYADGSTNLFSAPAVATLPVPGAVYFSEPNSSRISSNYAFDGTKACRIQWQWKDGSNIRWAHIVANATTGKRFPQIDTSKPITARVLILPVGISTAQVFNGTVSSITNSTSPAYATTTNTFGVAVTGPGPYTYQWSWSGGGLPNPTDGPTYTIDGFGAGVSVADNGTYTVEVSDGTCTETRSIVFTVADPLPIITNQPAQTTIAHVGENASFTVGAGAPVETGLPLTYQWRFNDIDIPDATAASFTTNNVQIADAGYYTVVVGNVYGSVTSRVAVLDVVQPAVVVGTGTGLRGNYYSSSYSTNPFAGPITLSRIDPTVDFDWLTGSPAPGISADFFTVRWSGQVRALDTDTYTFYVRSDDGQRLWVNGQLLVNDWALHGATEQSGSIALNANQHYDLVMEYFENGVNASSQLSWSSAGGGVVKGIIPTSQLYPASGTVTAPTLNFNLENGTNLVFNWGPGTYSLVWATNVAGPYTNRINGVVSPHTIVIGSEPQKFFRLQALQ